MKYDTYSKYDPHGVALAESAFLTAWAGLGAWHEDLVLVGGLVPRYLCADEAQHGLPLPRPVTLDADLGIAIGASIGQYGSLHDDLKAQDFILGKDSSGAPRFTKTVGEYTIPLDFLTEHETATTGTVMVDSIPASVLPGINRALATARVMNVTGVDLLGARQMLAIRVCEIGPFLMLKLRAFASRQQPKDAFDILYSLRHYDRGTDAALAGFLEEIRAGNPAAPDALRCLKDHFADEQSSAPVRAAHFVLGARQPGEKGDAVVHRLQIQQDMVDAGRLLQKAGGGVDHA